MYGYIYKTTNLINNKIYIGQHKSNTINDKYLGSGKNIQKAIKKYGKENFKKEVLVICETKEDLNKQEIYFIDYYNSRNVEIGYNISQGGHERFFTGCQHSEVSKKKMSEKAKNRPHPPTTNNTIWMNNSAKEKMIDVKDISHYEQNGWIKGRITKVGGKLKGLTKETSDAIKKMSDARKKILKEKPIGCCGYDKDNHMYIKFLEKVNSIDREEFIQSLSTIGKCKTCEKYHISGSKYKETLQILNIEDNYSYKLKKTV